LLDYDSARPGVTLSITRVFQSWLAIRTKGGQAWGRPQRDRGRGQRQLLKVTFEWALNYKLDSTGRQKQEKRAFFPEEAD
jgi:hypothetical protein